MMSQLLLLGIAMLVTHGGPSREVIQQGETTFVAGRVLSADGSLRPVRGAIVTLTPTAGRDLARSTITDRDGAFVIERPTSGVVRISAHKTAYVPAGEPAYPSGFTLEVGQGVQIDPLTLFLARGGAISGSISDEQGRPVEGAEVSAYALSHDGPWKRSTMVSTDDRGAYRLFGLNQGEYLVAVTAPMAALIGQVSRPTREDIDRILATLRTRGGRAKIDKVTLSPSPGLHTMLPVYPPGVLDVARAMLVQLRPGDDRSGVDVQLTVGRSASVEGRVVPPAGAMPSVSLTVVQEGVDFLTMANADVRPAPDGTFFLRGLPPGTYTVHARASGERLWARATIPVDGQDITGLSMMLQPTLTLRGVVSLTAVGQPRPTDMRTLRVSALNRSETGIRRRIVAGLSRTTLPGPVSLGRDGSFALAGLTPGTYEFQISGLPTGWTIASIGRNGHELPGGRLELTTNSGDGASITIVVDTAGK